MSKLDDRISWVTYDQDNNPQVVNTTEAAKRKAFAKERADAFAAFDAQFLRNTK